MIEQDGPQASAVVWIIGVQDPLLKSRRSLDSLNLSELRWCRQPV